MSDQHPMFTERVRLLLQYHLDHQPYYDAENNSFGGGGGLMEYEDEQQWAIKNGYIVEEGPVDADGRPCSGWVEQRISRKGMAVLAAENKRCGDRATRLVSGVRYFGPLKPIVFGGLFEVPLNRPVKVINHCVVVDGELNA